MLDENNAQLGSDDVLEQNLQELLKLAYFYHARGQLHRAQEIYGTILSLREKNQKQAEKQKGLRKNGSGGIG